MWIPAAPLHIVQLTLCIIFSWALFVSCAINTTSNYKVNTRRGGWKGSCFPTEFDFFNVFSDLRRASFNTLPPTTDNIVQDFGDKHTCTHNILYLTWSSSMYHPTRKCKYHWIIMTKTTHPLHFRPKWLLLTPEYCVIAQARLVLLLLLAVGIRMYTNTSISTYLKMKNVQKWWDIHIYVYTSLQRGRGGVIVRVTETRSNATKQKIACSPTIWSGARFLVVSVSYI